MRTRDVTQAIVTNAETIRQLHDRIRQTFRHRDESLVKWQEWQDAARDFTQPGTDWLSRADIGATQIPTLFSESLTVTN
ncbi:hypothetical protein ACFPT7_23610 [Acidicapsa dinghuensis]|uniref:Uncharacterized protein n=1 Tax=Acidicapsa dinghuensis TaxID=2218256 RepID=A0ABW1EPH9_9BACT|nr:hypothetical protein [Acidicapsa dinghuensis]